MCYISSTRYHRMKNTITGDGSDLEIMSFTDADHAGKVEHGYSTSGGFIAVTGPGTSVPLMWLSKKQTICSRSTTDAETISLAHTVFTEAVPLQEHLSSLLSRQVFMRCEQDNSSTIQVIANGYSAKVRHCSKTHKIDFDIPFRFVSPARCPFGVLFSRTAGSRRVYQMFGRSQIQSSLGHDWNLSSISEAVVAASK